MQWKQTQPYPYHREREREISQDRNILSSTWLQELHIEIKLKLKSNQCNEKK